jgi:hypothetical protein
MKRSIKKAVQVCSITDFRLGIAEFKLTTPVKFTSLGTLSFLSQPPIRRLAFFGSVLRDDFGPESDVDVLVEFDPKANVGFIKLAGIELEAWRGNRQKDRSQYSGLHQEILP